MGRTPYELLCLSKIPENGREGNGAYPRCHKHTEGREHLHPQDARARERKRLAFIDAGGTPEAADKLIDWLIEYVTKPKDRKAKIKALENASHAELRKMQRDVIGFADTDPKELDNSDNG